jgi:hypothetical protein
VLFRFRRWAASIIVTSAEPPKSRSLTATAVTIIAASAAGKRGISRGETTSTTKAAKPIAQSGRVCKTKLGDEFCQAWDDSLFCYRKAEDLPNLA